MTRTIFAIRSAAIAALVGLFILVNIAPSQASDFGVTIINDSSVEMTAFYTSETGTNSWGENRLGNYRLATGDFHWLYFDLDITDYDVNRDNSGNSIVCMFDFKAKFADGDEHFHRHINICLTETYHFVHHD